MRTERERRKITWYCSTLYESDGALIQDQDQNTLNAASHAVKRTRSISFSFYRNNFETHYYNQQQSYYTFLHDGSQIVESLHDQLGKGRWPPAPLRNVGPHGAFSTSRDVGTISRQPTGIPSFFGKRRHVYYQGCTQDCLLV
jgi:hypothetical protein